MPSKMILAILVLLAGLMSSSGPARAALVGVSGIIMDGDFASEQAAVADFLGVPVFLLDRTDDGVSGTIPTLLNNSPDLTGDNGAWNTTPVTDVHAIVIRAGTDFIILSYLGMAVTSDTWCTWGCAINGITLPGIFGAPGSGNESIAQQLTSLNAYSVVPIPAALPLFLSALAGLALIARRRKQVA